MRQPPAHDVAQAEQGSSDMAMQSIIVRMAIGAFLLGALAALLSPGHFWIATTLTLTYVIGSRIAMLAAPHFFADYIAYSLKQKFEQNFPATIHAPEVSKVLFARYRYVALGLTPFMLVGAMIGLSIAAALLGVGNSIDPITAAWNGLLINIAGVDTTNVIAIANVAVGGVFGWLARLAGYYLHEIYLYGPWRKEQQQRQLETTINPAEVAIMKSLMRYLMDAEKQRQANDNKDASG